MNDLGKVFHAASPTLCVPAGSQIGAITHFWAAGFPVFAGVFLLLRELPNFRAVQRIGARRERRVFVRSGLAIQSAVAPMLTALMKPSRMMEMQQTALIASAVTICQSRTATSGVGDNS
ncbi:hypothetical protein BQ8794_50627 [Mesorhizobium prunaredense]|uniref:Uncharacterized protein n=1 Tax=Mesorhizobium prunaredense TaxID=1631249 RepID=A0A1R3VFC5_9HYPH|nr:hypothetical protein BQ8794_50627 [Mesorhizobium prunaredense]